MKHGVKETSGLSSQRVKPWAPLALIVSGTWYVITILYAAVGPRGTDQYWYVSDISMANDYSLRATNTVYPSYSMLGSSPYPTSLPPPIHNMPVGYLAELVAYAGLPAYIAWVVTNGLLAITLAAMLYACARFLNLGSLALLPSILVIAFPLTLWQTVNSLADMSLMFGAALLLLGSIGYERRENVAFLWLTALAAVLLFWSRDDYVLILLSFIGYVVWSTWRRGRPSRGASALLLGVTIVAALLKPLFFHKHPTTGIVSSINSRTSMDFYFTKPSGSLGSLVADWTASFAGSVVPNSAVEVVTELPIIVAALAGLWVTRKSADLAVLRYWVVCFGVTYLAASTVFQAQNRYILPLVPGVALLTVSSLPLLKYLRVGGARVGAFLLVAVLVVFGLGSGLMASTYRSSAESASAITTATRSSLTDKTSGPLLTTADASEVLPLAHAVLPRPVLVVDPEENSPESTAQLVRRWDVAYVIGPLTDEDYLDEVASDRGLRLQRETRVQTVEGYLTVWSLR